MFLEHARQTSHLKPAFLIYLCITNYPKTHWFKGTNLDNLIDGVGQDFKSGLDMSP